MAKKTNSQEEVADLAPVEPQEVADLAPVEIATEEVAAEPQEVADLEPVVIDRARRDPSGALIIN